MGNVIFDMLLTGNAVAAWKAYCGLDAPQPADKRWGAVALYRLQSFDAAEDLLFRAISSGCVSAHIELATIYRHRGQLEKAIAELQMFTPAGSELIDEILYLSEFGTIKYAQGDLAGAIQALERAWRASFTVDVGEQLRIGIALALAVAHNSLGEPGHALRFLQRITKNPNEYRGPFVASLRGLSHVYNANPVQARSSFDQARAQLKHAPLLAPVLTHNEGLLHLLTGNIETADGHFAEAGVLAREVGEWETEFYAMQAQCATSTGLGEFEQAHHALDRAKALVSGKRMEALAALREGSLLIASGSDTYTGFKRLCYAQRTFKASGVDREEAWSYLHLAQAYVLSGDASSASLCIAKLVSLRNRWSSAAPLAIELSLTSKLVGYLSDRTSKMLQQNLLVGKRATPVKGEANVYLRVLGEPALEIEGRSTKLGLRFAPDIIAYLMLYPGRTIANISRALFPDVSSRKMQNYFHQLRHQLERTTPSLQIRLAEQRLYYLEYQGGRFASDYGELLEVLQTPSLQALEQGMHIYRGHFLEHRDEDWVEFHRERLRNRLLGSAYLAFEDILTGNWELQPDAGEIAKAMKLGWRLLELEPGEVELGEQILRLASTSRTPLQVRQVQGRLKRHYQAALGEIPDAIRDTASAGGTWHMGAKGGTS